ncbi:MAG: uroporphyrinogen-III C-methyltransferase [Legionellales bacterium]|nr:uroporphyrinogen-III C-methyltransferase [Legionellales bacterium]
MTNFPIFLKLENRPCLVVGGGRVAARKIEQLLKANAKVTLIAPKISSVLNKFIEDKKITFLEKSYERNDLASMEMVIAATDDREVNNKIAEHAKSKKIMINVVDNPDAGTFVMPSIIDRSPVIVAVSTGGASPVLTRLLRARLEILIPASYGKLASLISIFRETVKERFPSIDERRRFWEQLLQGPIAELIYTGQDQKALNLLEKKITNEFSITQPEGEVYLVGGGPGDPDLLTFRALRLMQQADIVLYDRLVAPDIVNLVRKDAERIYVGKERDKHTVSQEEINQLLVELAKKGKRVLRLKGGDPFIFGRGGEEIDLLSENNIPFQIVPGITAASGCASYAGIPLTHRKYAQSCLFITGHLKDGTMNLNWSALVQPQQTLAVYMGTHGIEILSRELIKHGLPKTTPAAIVQQGTTKVQKTYITTVEDLPNIPKQNEVKPPSMIIIGDVVSLHEKLAWFGQPD